jgi:hypothetical protein
MARRKRENIENRLVRLKKGVLSPSYRVGYCFGGFGAFPDTTGTAVFLRFLDGRTCRVERYDVEAIVTGPEGSE